MGNITLRIIKFKDKFMSMSEKNSTIIRLIGKGLTNKEIGDQISVSENTIKYHIKNLFLRYGVNTKAELIYAYYSGKGAVEEVRALG